MKKLIYLIVAIAILGLIVPGCLPVVPPTEQNETSGLMKWNSPDLFVDDDYTSGTPGWGSTHFATIGEAITAASGGNTIEVAEGTYTEAVTVNKSVTLLGAKYDIDPAGGLDRGGESVIVGQVTITANDATINGFKLTSSYIAAGYPSAKNVNISYNILENVTATWGAIHLHGKLGEIPPYHQCDGAYVGYNTISGDVGDGIWTVGNDNVTIEYNYILSSSGFASIQALNHVGTGIVIHGNTITNSGGKGINYWAEDDGEITDNVITNSNFEAIYTDAQATISGNQISGGSGYGILVANGADNTIVSGNTISNPSYEGIQSDVPVTITNNDISGGYNGIQLSNTASGSVIDGNSISNPSWNGINSFVQVNINYNDISGGYNGIQIYADEAVIYGNNIHDNQYWGLAIQGSVNTATVTNNQFTNNPYCGVVVWEDGNGSGIHINYNEIIGNGIYGVESKRTASDVDAENNWWGDVSGPSGVGQGTGDAVSDYVDYDPWIGQGGMVTGGGWIMSPAGAYTPDTNLSGKATFGFVSMYKKGADVPTGNTQFNFQVADLNFHADSYDWLVIAGPKAMYKGTGTINGTGDYGFMLSAIDEKLTPSTEVDKFRIKIWDKSTDTVIYDNKQDGEDGTEIAGGQIVIHKGK